MKTKTIVEFEGYEEAARFIAKYAGCQGGSPAYRALAAEFGTQGSPEIAREAVRVLAARFNVEVPSNDSPEPTYTDSTGQTFRVRDMCPQFIRNALARYPYMPTGLRAALLAALRRQED